MNPLLHISTETFPFDKANASNLKEGILHQLEQAKTDLKAIENNQEPANFNNTIVKMEFLGFDLNRLASCLFNLNSANTSTEIQELCREIAPKLSSFSNDVTLSQKLFEKVKHVYESEPAKELTEEQKRLLNETFSSFTRNGANLSDEKKKELRDYDEQLSLKSLKFGENLLADTQNYYLLLEKEENLKGLNPEQIQTAKKEAESRKIEGWAFTLQYPSYLPFMKYAESRELRKELYLAFGAKGFQENENNNEKLIKEIVALRAKRAKLLGFNSHAEFVLKKRMAAIPSNVYEFLDEILEPALALAKNELEELRAFAKQMDEIEVLMPWDHLFYTEKLRNKKFQLSDNALKPYFELNSVLHGAFNLAHKLFGLSFKRSTQISVYHNEVQTYEVYDENNSFLALLYTDFHPRASKRAGAWMTSYLSQHKDVRPHVSIVCNFSPPTEKAPALLTFQEVTTLFHEFGHALHGILANTTYPSLSGTNVYWDFVELPSQFMENFCYEEEVLKTFAKHHETGEQLSNATIKKLHESRSFMEGYQTVRQVGLAKLDMEYHSIETGLDSEVADFEEAVTANIKLYPKVQNVCTSASFAHIFQGGYSAGYYSYKWAEVLDADAFAYFKENGIWNKETALSFKKLLASGGTIDPMDLYIAFRKSKPTSKALLERIKS